MIFLVFSYTSILQEIEHNRHFVMLSNQFRAQDDNSGSPAFRPSQAVPRGAFSLIFTAGAVVTAGRR
jgi:hypothetical protein